MSEPFLGEIKVISWNFPPKGWAFCNGQLLPINQNQALFSLLGVTFGGDGRQTFALPNLQGRVPIHAGNGFSLGEVGGEATHTLSVSELPTHTHLVTTGANPADQLSPAGNYVASSARAGFAPHANGLLAPGLVSTVGGSQPHENESPYLVLNFVIALQGIFPSRN
jgi:microcystin-dependent protein